VRGARDLGAQSVELVALAAMVAGMVFFGSQLGNKSMSYWQRQILTYERQIEEQRPAQRRVDGIRRQHQETLQRLQILADRLDPRDFWLRVVTNIQRVKPPEVLVTRLFCTVDPYEPWSGRVRITAQAENQSALNDFARELRDNLAPYVQSAADVQVPTISPSVQSAHFSKPAAEMQIVMTVWEQGGKQIVRVLPEVTPAPQRSGDAGDVGEDDMGGGEW